MHCSVNKTSSHFNDMNKMLYIEKYFCNKLFAKIFTRKRSIHLKISELFFNIHKNILYVYKIIS